MPVRSPSPPPNPPPLHNLIIDPVTELMRHRPAGEAADKPTQKTIFQGRDGLAAYTIDPESFPPTRVVYHNDKFVVINDLYPKATVHLLILPRDPRKNVLRPQDAFDDPQFLADCREEEKKVRKIVASELRRRFGKFSASDRPRIEAFEADELPETLPAGRDWTQGVMSGIHANPSMSHLHIHVLSKDMVSDPMKRRNHYLSFTTDFLVGLEHFPLAKDDYRRAYHHFPEDMLCWRCGQNFGNKMTELKKHLNMEKQSWIRE
jgi:aprataxin